MSRWHLASYSTPGRPARVPLAALDQPGVFETFRVDRAEGMWIEDHLTRLGESARAMGLSIPDRRPLAAWIQKQVRRFRVIDGAARLAIWRLPEGGCSTVLWLRRSEEEGVPAGIRLKTSRIRSSTPRETDAAIKANHYLMQIAESVSGISSSGGAAPLFLNAQDHVTESATANLFAVRNKVLWTPHTSCGILDGITRRRIMEAAAKIGWKTIQTCLTRHDLYCSDEVFLTSSLSVAVPVTQIDGRRIGNGLGGKEWKRIRQGYFALWRAASRATKLAK